jgi:transposase InsO family protein
MNYDKLLDVLYYKEHNYDGVDTLYKKAKLRDNSITKNIVKEWLQNQSTHQQTTQDTKKKVYKPIYSESHYNFQIDLTFLDKYKKSNDGNYVLFTAINVNSRYAYIYYSKSKDAKAVIDMLNKFKKNALEIDIINGDLDSAFTSKECTKWFEDNKIKTFFYKSDSHKLGKINRFHRTLKEKLLKKFTATDDTNWIDIIDKILKNYNNTVNTSTGYTPTEASNSFIQTEIISNARNKTEAIETKEINVGDKCRILKDKKIFDKMQTKYTEEIYNVIKVNKNTVDIENDYHILKNIKKTNIIIIKNSFNSKSNVNKQNEEKQSKIQRRLQKEGMDTTLLK